MKHGKRSNDPLWWVPFGGGMMVDALALPALVIITGFLIPLGVLQVGGLQQALLHPLVRLVVAGIAAATFFHAAHRIRYCLPELGMHGLKPVMAPICYGLAILGSAAAVAVALRLI